MICPNCKQENSNSNIRCIYCSQELINTNEINQILTPPTQEITVSTKKFNKFANIIIMIICLPSLLAGIVTLGIDFIPSIIEAKQIEGYEETTATFKTCHYENGLCKAIYEYKVNNITYSTSPDLLSNRDYFKDQDTVYYNPNNPNESIIRVHQNDLSTTIMGILFISVSIFIFIVSKIFVKKITNNEENVKMTVTNYNKTNI